ncbi:hypothetical protein B0T17DRAFT_651622 [Bombardia bombarda]|uniref:Large ribosomal subunit protein uL23m n=1 Tax=Bombardia bombarda TaxID=252184 RepID=A0AA39XMV4_9PEZI|nr:hypothetical protein B0T17DRAFT_651622 [Bombardia bombarda]
MATSVSEAAARLAPNFRVGAKKLYLPNHVITFIRPKPQQPANLATFVVPLKFNKLDLRDYLFHAYGVRVNARKNERGKWYRPQSQKMMIAELVEPFAWPEAPGPNDPALKAFDNETFQKVKQTRDDNAVLRAHWARGDIPLRNTAKQTAVRKDLKRQAAALAAGEETWGNRTMTKEEQAEAEEEERMLAEEEEEAETEARQARAVEGETEGEWKEVEKFVEVPRAGGSKTQSKKPTGQDSV